MAADVAEELKSQEGGEQAASPAPKRSSKKKLLIGALVLMVIVVQAIVTYLLLPGAEKTHKLDEKDHAAAEPAPEPEVGAIDGDVAEVPVGDFSFSNGTAVPGSIIHVDFKMSAVASAKQASNLEQQFKMRQARIRQAVNKIVRSSNLEELNDPNLGTIKRLIREEINRQLTRSYVIEIVITDIRTMEQ